MGNKRLSQILIGLLICLIWTMSLTTVAAAQPLPDPDKITYAPLRFKMPQSEKILLNNGMVLFYLPDHELPLVSLSIIIRTGTAYDPPGKEGLADLTAYLLRTGGTKRTGSDEMDQRLDFLGVSPAISMSLDSATVHFTFLKKDLDVCLDLLSQMLKEPAFDERKFRLALSLKEEELRRIADNPQKIAFREYNRLLYPDDPRGRYPTSESLRNIRREDLIEFHKRFFASSNMMIAVSGDISAEQTVNRLQHYFSGFNQHDQKPDFLPTPNQISHGTFIIRKTIPQSTIVTGELTIGKNNHDFYTFTVLDFIVGSGGFASRIFSSVRNKEGLAYSAGSFYRARGNYGILGTYAFTKTSSTGQAIDLINSILHDVSSGNMTQQELDWAKKSILNGFIFSFEQPAQIAVQQMYLSYDQLPADYLINYQKNIESVTLADLKRVAAQYLIEKKRLIVILGDTDQLGKIPENWGSPIFIIPKQ